MLTIANPWRRRLCGTVLMALTVSMLEPGVADQPGAAGIEFFENRIRPVLVKHCYKCHSSEAKSSKGGLLLDTRAGTLQGGETGPAVVSGEVDESLLIDAIRYESFEMPPDGPLPENVIADFVTWVNLGAPDPRSQTPTGSKSTETQSDFWAFQPPQRAEAAQVERRQWPATSIDQFVLARMESEGLAPVRDADRRSLLRRVYFDLIGLPPTPQQLADFVNDTTPTPLAFERVVDQLLDSPHFGERWARHWLDVARFAESTGKEWNWAHPQAWRYRDYVIESFNDDKAYDQFLREQIAGDLLPAHNSAQRDEQLIATGFLAIGPKAVSIGNDEEFGLELADEQINTVTRGVLGLTVGCARCHDHKFDPISAEDYYALSGVFLSTKTLFGTSASGYKGRNNKQGTPLLPIGPEAEILHQAYVEYEKQLAEFATELQKHRDELKKLAEEQREKEGRHQEATEHETEGEPDEQREQRMAELQAAIGKQERELEDRKSNPPPKADYAMGVRDRDDPKDCQVRLGGELDQLGDSVPRGFLNVVKLTGDFDISPTQSGRGELARWLTHRDHPLTARVMVNRMWQYLFGRGLVSTVDNFGWLGQRPSHPRLLDHLAVSFIDDGWSVKRMLRRMVLSRTYRLSTFYQADQVAADPDNQLLWRMTPRRLEAEEIRDAILAISGRLKRDPLEGSPAVARLDEGWIGNEVKEPEFKNYTHNHRSVYLPIVRDQIPEMLQTFDFPDPAEVTGQREVSVVPAQALYLMNSDFVIACAREAAEQLIARDEVSEAHRISWAYQAVLGRPPTPSEQTRDLKMITEVDRVFQKSGLDRLAARRDAWAAFYQSLFSSGEFLHLF